MQCIYAILFLAGKNALMTDRLVLLYHNGDSFYGVYKPHSETLFPSPSPQHNLIISTSKVTGPGTYNSLYCSPTLEAPVIKDIISEGLTKFSDKEVLPLDKAHMKLDSCRQQIINLSHGPAHQRPNTLNQLLKRKICTVSHVITLAHEGKIFVNGYNNFDAPNPATGTFSIDVSRELPVKLIVSSDYFVYLPMGNKEYVLAWSQGQLHVFKRDKFWSQWIQQTKIGAEADNVVKIIRILAEVNAGSSRVTITMNGNNLKIETNPSILSESDSEDDEGNPFPINKAILNTLKGSLPSRHISSEEGFTLA